MRPEDVSELAEVQARLLRYAATAVKPGGRLVYAVCTLTRRETTGVADEFTATHPDFVPDVALPGRPAGTVTLWPHEWRSNGMAVAAWRRR
jgi:16S rRNA (cytosine967-C5)-methyltransferase